MPTNVPFATFVKAIRLSSYVDNLPDYILLTACVNVISAYRNNEVANDDDIFLVDIWDENAFRFPPGTETEFDYTIYFL